MRRGKQFFRKYAKKIVAIAVIAILFGLSRLPVLSATERNALASQFHFNRFPLSEVSGETFKVVRSVHPSLAGHSAWISAVGAAVALSDLDGDGLPNDVCLVDPRTDKVTVATVPETRDRYLGFELTSTANDEMTAPMGCLPGDINEDGRMDLLVYYWGRTPIAFLRNEQPSLNNDSFIAQEISASGERWYTNAATFADLDGDGHNDLIIGNYFQDNSEILNPNGTGSESMQHSMTRAENGGNNRILRWTSAASGSHPSVQFEDISTVLDDRVNQAWTLAIGAADLDGDLLPEIYFANDFGRDRMLHNRSTPGHVQLALLEGRKGFTTPNSKVLGRDAFKGMGVDFGDVNHDGWLDIYVSNIADEYALEESHFLFTSTGETDLLKKGIAPYRDRSEPLGVSRSSWSWDTKFGDFNNDGELEALQATGFAKGEVDRWAQLQEMALGNDELLSYGPLWHWFQPGDDLSGHDPNPFFVRSASGRYYDLGKELGLATPSVTRGIATADVDGDGDLDFAVANQWETSYFYRNDSPHPGKFLGLRLLHERFGSPVVGAGATVNLPNGQKLVAQVDGGNGHSGVRSQEIHFGLGQLSDETSVLVELHWRDVSGQVHEQSLSLSPGWHRVFLGDKAKKVS